MNRVDEINRAYDECVQRCGLATAREAIRKASPDTDALIAALKAATGGEKKPLQLARGSRLSVVDSLRAMAETVYGNRNRA